MNRFHELFTGSRYLTPGTEEYLNCVASTKFDMGEMLDVFDLYDISTRSFFQIPAPICLFQFTHNGIDLHFVLAVDKGDYVQWLHMWKGISTGFGLWDNNVWVDIYKDGSRIDAHRRNGEAIEGDFVEKCFDWIANGDKQPGPDGWSLAAILTTACAVEVFSCSNVFTIAHEQNKFINAKRVKKKKLPFFSYKTLHIKDGKESLSGRDGESIADRNSPRLHFRRGHIRRMANGRKTWVSSCLVGDKSKGMVHKDYKL